MFLIGIKINFAIHPNTYSSKHLFIQTPIHPNTYLSARFLTFHSLCYLKADHHTDKSLNSDQNRFYVEI